MCEVDEKTYQLFNNLLYLLNLRVKACPEIDISNWSPFKKVSVEEPGGLNFVQF